MILSQTLKLLQYTLAHIFHYHINDFMSKIRIHDIFYISPGEKAVRRKQKRILHDAGEICNCTRRVFQL